MSNKMTDAELDVILTRLEKATAELEEETRATEKEVKELSKVIASVTKSDSLGGVGD